MNVGFRALAVCLMLFLPLRPGIAAEVGPGQVVDRLHLALLDVMKRAGELGYQGRSALLTPVVESSFDFPTIARIVMGRHWAGLGNEEQQAFLKTFSRLSTATYAARFDSYGGEDFRLVAEEPQKDKILVRSELVKADGSVVKFDYLVHPGKDGGWLIVNVIADGVSDLSVKRADYTTILKNEGYAALIAKLNDKIAQYEEPGR
jgi:phospholipid transport system substrate-binding protein